MSEPKAFLQSNGAEGYRARALSDLMHLSIVLEPAVQVIIVVTDMEQ